jgi:hypothetical protein
LIAVVLVTQLLDAIPLPELKPQHLQNPVARRELAQWSGALSTVGVELSPQRLAELGLTVGEGATAFRHTVLRPWHPLRRLTGTGQAWGLFAYPEPATGRLVVEAHTAQGTEQLYRAPGDGDAALVEVLAYRRMRGIYDDASDRPTPRKIYHRFGQWVAAGVMTERPGVTAVEVRLDLHPVRTPDEGEPVPDTRRHARLYTRAMLEEAGLLEAVP